MKKLTLNLDELAVESFDTQAVGAERGTVRGHEDTDAVSCFGSCAPATKCGCVPPSITLMPTDANCPSQAGCTGGVICTFECPTYAWC
jgi:hypothetical protein